MKTVAIVLVLLSSQAFCQEITFTNENITFRLTSTHFYVDAFYWFVNVSDHDATSLIYYPVPITNENDVVDSLDIFNITEGTQPKISNKTNSGFSFILSVRRKDTVVCHIAYRQRVVGDSARYILRSTQAWGRALEFAEYKLIVGSSIVMTGFSYKPDKIYGIDGKSIYLWKRSHFMPDRDMVFHFKTTGRKP